jgi:8-oxo-dGTP pyrophosphatase MutT (NUDIX family)
VSNDRLYPPRPILAASLAVFRDGKVLIASRTAPPAQALFSLPGGVVEIGETLQDAALREVMEEVGVAAEIVGFVDHAEVIQRESDGSIKRHFVITCFAGRWISGEGHTSAEAGAVLWVDPDAMGSIPTTKGLPTTLRKAKAVVEGREIKRCI